MDTQIIIAAHTDRREGRSRWQRERRRGHKRSVLSFYVPLLKLQLPYKPANFHPFCLKKFVFFLCPIDAFTSMDSGLTETSSSQVQTTSLNFFFSPFAADAEWVCVLHVDLSQMFYITCPSWHNQQC